MECDGHDVTSYHAMRRGGNASYARKKKLGSGGIVASRNELEVMIINDDRAMRKVM
jgi:hypothetical protein